MTPQRTDAGLSATHGKPIRRPGYIDGVDAKSYAVEAVERAIDILQTFSQTEPALSLGEIVAKSGLAKATAFRMLWTLCNRGVCRLNRQTGKYGLSFEILKMAAVCRRPAKFDALAMPLMRALRDLSNETVILSIRDGDFRVTIDYVESLAPLRRIPEPGVRSPLYVSAASKAFLACMSDEEIDAYLARTPLEPMQPTTITDPAVLWDAIRTIRDLGYAESIGERVGDGRAIAAPIRDFTGQAAAVISISYVTDRFVGDVRDRSIAALLDGTLKLSRELGADDARPDIATRAPQRYA